LLSNQASGITFDAHSKAWFGRCAISHPVLLLMYTKERG